MQRKHLRKKIAVVEPDTTEKEETARRDILFSSNRIPFYRKNGLGQEGIADDPNFPIDTVAVVLFDRGTKWLSVYPKATKSAFHTIEAMQHFARATDNIANFYCDNAPELITSARACKWRLATATTGMPQVNGVAEWSVRIVKEGGGCGIVQSGFNPTWWPEVGEHFCIAKSIAIVNGDSSLPHTRHRTLRW